MSIAAVFRYPVLIDAFFIMEEEIHLAAGMDKVELEGADYAVSYEAVDSLLGKSIIYESWGRLIGMHDLLREFSLSRLTPRQRRVYHRAAARYYLQDGSAPARVEGLYHSLMAATCRPPPPSPPVMGGRSSTKATPRSSPPFWTAW